MIVEFTDCIVLEIPPEVEMSLPMKVRVLIAGTEPLPHALPFAARFDAEPIVAPAVDAAGTGFTGYMAEAPAEGARLFVEFPGEEEEIDTGFTFHADQGGSPNV